MFTIIVRSIVLLLLPLYTQQVHCAAEPDLESVHPLAGLINQTKQAVTHSATMIIKRYEKLNIPDKQKYITAVAELHQQAQTYLVKLEAFERVAATALQQPIIKLIGNTQQQVLEDTVLSIIQQAWHQDISNRIGINLLPITNSAEDSLQSINQAMSYQPQQCLQALEKTIATITAHSLLVQSFAKK